MSSLNEVPQGWKQERFSNFIEMQRGFDLPVQDRIDGQIDIIAASGVIGKHNEPRVKGPGVVTGRSGTIGKVMYELNDFWPLNTTLYIKDFKGNLPKYVYYFLEQFDLARFSNGTGVPTLNRNDVHPLEITFPPLEEQRKIAAILSAWDETIEQQTRLIELKRERKRGLMQQLLTGRVRFEEFKGLEWQARKLSKIITDFIVPMRDKPKSLVGDIPWCRVEDFNGIYLTNSKSGQYVDQNTVREMNLKVYPVGTLLVSCSANLGVCAITAVPLVTNQTFIGLVPDPKVADTLYLYYAMTNAAPALNRLSSGTTISYLSRRQFEDFTIKVPPLPEQQKIAAVLSTADAELGTLTSQLKALKEQKRGLMQQLLTGKTRVQVA